MNPPARAGRGHHARWLTTVLASVLIAFPAAAIERGTTPSGLRFASGGIGLAERDELFAERQQYRLWVATVARGSGAYLSDALVWIAPAAGGDPVLERTMDGPWLFVELPAGRYSITATLPASNARPAITESAQVQVAALGLHQAILRFPVRTEVSPERAKPFGGNPFGASAPQ